MIWYVILLTAIRLTPGGSSTVLIYTQTIHRTTQNKQYTEQHNNLGECGPMIKPFCISVSSVPDSGAFPPAADWGQRSIQQSGEPAAQSWASGATQVAQLEAVLHRAARSVAVEVGFFSLWIMYDMLAVEQRYESCYSCSCRPKVCCDDLGLKESSFLCEIVLKLSDSMH